LPDGGILPESAAAKIEEHKQRKKALSELNSINARIADNREKAIEIKNEVINKGGDKEVLKSELIKAFPDKDDLAAVASYFKETDENSDTDFSLSDDEIREMIDSVGKTATEEKVTEILQGVGGGKKDNATKPTTPPTTKPETKTEPTEEKPKKNFFETDPSLLKRANAIRSKWEKEMKTPHQFYSRIFSVPEWFPKGLDEFREKKRELTDKPVYDKKSGKYVRNTTGKMATAKAEQEMAEEVIDGLQRDVNRAKLKGSVSDPVLNKRSKEQYEKSVSVLNDINKQIDDIDKEYNDLSAIEYKGTDYDSLAKEQDRKERLSALRQQREEAKNKLSEQEDIVNKFKTQYETRDDATSNLIESQQETIDAIRNGDLKDANEAVDNLKEEYRAAKRKLIKENAGDIARNVWFIIDLVTTMNRNAARLMPQGKYSPNLGNFETPALFQDYAAQLQNMRDAYNKVNTERSMADIEADKKEMSNIFDVDKQMMDLIPQEYRNELTLKLNKGNAEIEKDLARLRAALNVDVTDKIANRALFRFYLTEPDIVAKMNTKQIKDFWTVARMKAEGYDDIALNSFKEQLNEQLQKGNTREAAAMIERLAKNTLDYKVATPEQLKTLQTIQNIRSGVGVVGDAVGTIKDAVSIFSPIPITAAGATQ
jgi:hypothetical protein